MASTPEQRLEEWRACLGSGGWLGLAAKNIVPMLEREVAERKALQERMKQGERDQ